MNELILNLIIFSIGLLFLFLASDWLIQSSVRMAYILRIAPLLIGLIFIAFGTSAPEAAVSIIASAKNQGAIALGDIVGSSIANIGLVLSVCALFRPVRVDRKIFRREIPLVIFAAITLYIFCLDLQITRLEGLLFLMCFTMFCVFACNDPYFRQETREEIKDFKFKKLIRKIKHKRIIFLIFFASLVFVILGANVMVKSGITIAKIFKISPWVIGLTLFAIGTSLPEMAVTWTAFFQRVPSISIGNIIGSDIFNILLVLGVASLVRPITIDPSILKFELPVMILFILTLSLFMRTGYTLKRLEGGILFIAYVFFMITLFMR